MKKDILKFALSVITLLVLLSTISVPVSASGDHNIINVGETNMVLIGQKLQFQGSDIGKTIKGDPGNEYIRYFRAIATIDFESNDHFRWGGAYFIDDGDGKLETNGDDTVLYVTDPHMDLDLKIDSRRADVITKGQLLTINFDNNLDADDIVTLKITDPNEDILTRNPTDDTVFADITVKDLSKLEIKTDGWDLGDYEFLVETKKEKARGLDLRSYTKSLIVLKPEICIDADRIRLTETERTTLAVMGLPNHDIIISSSDPDHTIFKGGINDYLGPDTGGPISDTIGQKGVRKYAVIFTETGSYTMTVRDIVDNLEDGIDIIVTEKEVFIDVLLNVVIGDDFEIRGAANAGKYVDIAINDEVVPKLNDVVIDVDREFKVTIRTNADYAPDALKAAGPVKIKAYLDRAASGNIQPNEKEDAFVAILMCSPCLTVELSHNEINLGNEFAVSGAAPGTKNVDILTIAPKGGSGIGLNGDVPLPNTEITGITYTRTPVFWDYDFSVNISISKYADPGTYFVVVLTPGPDGKYNGIDSDNILDITKGKYGDIIMTQDNKKIVSMLQEATVGAQGSDDLMWAGAIKIGTSTLAGGDYVKLNLIADVVIGEALVVNGTTTREEGHPIFITVEGPVELSSQLAPVRNGAFTAAFDTCGAIIGAYTVKADDLEGHTDEIVVNIVPITTVLFDETRLFERYNGVFEKQISETEWYGCSGFADTLRDNGFSVSKISDKPITYEKINGFDVLVILSAGEHYSDSEINAIEKFVKNGGKLFLACEIWKEKSTSTDGHTNEIARRFGVSFAKNGHICDATDYYESEKDYINCPKISNIKSHEITKDIKSFYLVGGTYIKETGSSKVLAYTDKDAWFDDFGDNFENFIKDKDEKSGRFPVLAEMTYGNGKIVFMGDSSLFTNGWRDKLNNEQIGVNIAKWLAEPISVPPSPPPWLLIAIALTIAVMGFVLYGRHRHENRQEIDLKRTIWDPTNNKPITTSGEDKEFPVIQETIERLEKGDKFKHYWFVLCIANHTNKGIGRFSVRFETKETLKILSVYVEGREVIKESEISDRIRKAEGSDFDFEKYRTKPISESIPPKESRRVYFKLSSDGCGIDYEIKNGRVDLPDLDLVKEKALEIAPKSFHYSCEVPPIENEEDLKDAVNWVKSEKRPDDRAIMFDMLVKITKVITFDKSKFLTGLKESVEKSDISNTIIYAGLVSEHFKNELHTENGRNALKKLGEIIEMEDALKTNIVRFDSVKKDILGIHKTISESWRINVLEREDN